MSYLSKDAIYSIDPFFYNSTFINFKIFIILLKQIYNNGTKTLLASF